MINRLLQGVRAALAGSAQDQAAARQLYECIVGQAREAAFYRDWRVPDTVDGRFEMIVLHMFVLLTRLKRAAAGQAIGEALAAAMVDDMDRSLREMGVGDLSVGKKVKFMMRAFYGRLLAYEAAVAAADESLHEALRRNLFGTAEADQQALGALASYVREALLLLDGQGDAALLAGTVAFPAPPTAAMP